MSFGYFISSWPPFYLYFKNRHTLRPTFFCCNTIKSTRISCSKVSFLTKKLCVTGHQRREYIATEVVLKFSSFNKNDEFTHSSKWLFYCKKIWIYSTVIHSRFTKSRLYLDNFVIAHFRSCQNSVYEVRVMTDSFSPLWMEQCREFLRFHYRLHVKKIKKYNNLRNYSCFILSTLALILINS